MKVLIVLAASVALSAARPSYLGLGGIGAAHILGIPPAAISVAVAPSQPAPVSVTDTPEVAAAKAEHLAAVAEAAAAPAAPAPAEPAPAAPAPEPVQDTPEVAAAKAEHLAAVAEAATPPAAPAPAPLVAPEPVQDTPEVAAAKAAHLAGVAKVAAAAAAPVVPAVTSTLLYTGVQGLGLGLSTLAHAPIAHLGWPAVAW